MPPVQTTQRACLRSVFALGLLVAAPIEAQTFFQADPKGAYLRTSANDAPSAPLIIALDAFAPSSSLFLKPEGKLQVAGAGSPQLDAVFCGLFSTSSTLLATNELNRVPGALMSAAAASSSCNSAPTLNGGLPTDIPGDFFIPFSGLAGVSIPTGASFLFIAVPDNFFADNVSPNPNGYGLTVSSEAVSVPEPSAAVLFATGVVGVLLQRRRGAVRTAT